MEVARFFETLSSTNNPMRCQNPEEYQLSYTQFVSLKLSQAYAYNPHTKLGTTYSNEPTQ
jgi:hypothetical protein